MSIPKPSLDLSMFLCKSNFFPKYHYRTFYWQIVQWYYHSHPACDSPQYQILLPLYEFQQAFQLLYLERNHHRYLMVFFEAQCCFCDYTNLFYYDQKPTRIFYSLTFHFFAEASGFRFTAFRASITESFTSSKLSSTITATYQFWYRQTVHIWC